jgi:hypothetical protein
MELKPGDRITWTYALDELVREQASPNVRVDMILHLLPQGVTVETVYPDNKSGVVISLGGKLSVILPRDLVEIARAEWLGL